MNFASIKIYGFHVRVINVSGVINFTLICRRFVYTPWRWNCRREAKKVTASKDRANGVCTLSGKMTSEHGNTNFSVVTDNAAFYEYYTKTSKIISILLITVYKILFAVKHNCTFFNKFLEIERKISAKTIFVLWMWRRVIWYIGNVFSILQDCTASDPGFKFFHVGFSENHVFKYISRGEWKIKTLQFGRTDRQTDICLYRLLLVSVYGRFVTSTSKCIFLH